MRRRVLWGAALVGVLMQWVGRSQIGHASWTANEGYRVLIFLGIAATALAAACAVFLLVRRRASRSGLPTVLASITGAAIFVAVGFYGIYWPWIHAARPDLPFPRMRPS
jgi:predicted membrane channel-forming protein YqfA (hemolysin III family)